MPDENDDIQPENAENDATAPESAGTEHGLKEELRGAAAKAWGIAVEVGSLLGGESGEIVDAERTVAEADAEGLLDRIDGEG